MTHDVFDDHTAQYKENLIPNVGQVACKELIASAATESLSIQHEAGELLEEGGGAHYWGLKRVVWFPRRACECFKVVSRGGIH